VNCSQEGLTIDTSPVIFDSLSAAKASVANIRSATFKNHARHHLRSTHIEHWDSSFEVGIHGGMTRYRGFSSMGFKCIYQITSNFMLIFQVTLPVSALLVLFQPSSLPPLADLTWS